MADLASVRARVEEAHDEASLALGVPVLRDVINGLAAERDAAVAALTVTAAARDALQAKLDQVRAIVNA